jgi:hypothetical protein
MNNDKLICIREEDDSKLIQLQSEGYKIIQISASGIYCWVLLRKPNFTKKDIKGFFNENTKPNIKPGEDIIKRT